MDADAMLYAGVALGAVVLASAAALLLRRDKETDGSNKSRAAIASGNGIEASSGRDGRNGSSSSSSTPGGDLVVCFGSQTGTAEGFANSLKAEGKRHGFRTTVLDLEDFTVEALTGADKVIFLMATYGEGDPTDNAVGFEKYVSKAAEALEEKENAAEATEADRPMVGLHFAVFGLGNKQYEHYNRMGKATDKQMEVLGGERMFEYGEGDDDADLDEDFEAWKEKLWPALVERFIGLTAADEEGNRQGSSAAADEAAEVEALAAPFSIRYLSAKAAARETRTPASQAASSTRFYWESTEARVAVNRELRNSDKEGTGSTRHVEIDLRGTGVTYETADNLAVMPQNSPGSVESLARHMGYELQASFTLDYSSESNGKALFPTPCSVQEALTSYVDFNSVPHRSLLERLRPLVKDKAQRRWLEHIVSREPQAKELFRHHVEDEQRTLLELLLGDLSSLHIPLDTLLHTLPRLHPRYYTISSSSSVHPQQAAITVAVLARSHSQGREFRGICTNFLAGLEGVGPAAEQQEAADHTCRIFVKASTFRLPAEPSTPIIMVGPGTGIAPMRALLQERQYRRAAEAAAAAAAAAAGEGGGGGGGGGRNTLFFGCRREDEDYIYREELEAWQQDGTLDALHLAFSRQGAAAAAAGGGGGEGAEQKKVYVQHLATAQSSTLWSQLQNEGACVYVCGGTAMGQDVHRAFVGMAQREGDMSEKEAVAYVAALQKGGRYVQELWS